MKVAAPNVHFLGPKRYAELPRYLRHIDVCVLPWRHQHVFTSYGSAIKVREYLATGKPVVMAPLYEYRDTPGIRFYGNADQFVAAVEEALAHDTAAQRELRQNQVRNSTWDTRAQQLGALVASLLQARRPEESQIDESPEYDVGAITNRKGYSCRER
jgi:glycosyltransferase involved in cell wall biosynthesis